MKSITTKINESLSKILKYNELYDKIVDILDPEYMIDGYEDELKSAIDDIGSTFKEATSTESDKLDRYVYDNFDEVETIDLRDGDVGEGVIYPYVKLKSKIFAGFSYDYDYCYWYEVLE